MSDFAIPRYPFFMEKSMNSLPLEAIGEIAGSKDFSGFLTASELAQALESDPSANLSVAVENKSQGNIDHLLGDDRPQGELEEPQANSTLIDPIVDKSAAKRAKRSLYRKRKRMYRSLSKLTTNPPNGEGNHDPEAGPSGTQPPGSDRPPAAKQGTGSSGETPEPKRPRQGDSPPDRPSYAEASSRAIFISIVPLDSEGNDVRATLGDKHFLVEKLEEFIARSGPNINITEFSLRGESLRLGCLNQRTLESVKRVVCPLKGPRGNLQGYRCLGPGDRPPLVTYGVWVGKPVPKKTQLVAILKDANNWINPKKMVVKAEIPKQGKGSTFLIGVEPEIRAELERRNFKLQFGVGRTAHFKAKPKRHQNREGEAT